MRNAGFTLIELLIGVVIMALAFWAIIFMFINALPENAQLEAQNQAIFLAEGKLEEVKARSFAALTAEAGSFTGNFGQYAYLVTVASLEAGKLKQISVFLTGGLLKGSVEVTSLKGPIY